MVRLRRIERRTEVVHAAKPLALVETNWFLIAGGKGKAVGFSYRSPRTVEFDGKPPIRIRDYVMLARLGVLAVTVLGTLLIRRKRL